MSHSPHVLLFPARRRRRSRLHENCRALGLFPCRKCGRVALSLRCFCFSAAIPCQLAHFEIKSSPQAPLCALFDLIHASCAVWGFVVATLLPLLFLFAADTRREPLCCCRHQL